MSNKLIDVDLERLYQQMSEDKELDKLLNTTEEEFKESTNPALKKYFYLLKELSFISFNPLTLLEVLKAPSCHPLCPKKHLKFLENEEEKITGFVIWETSWEINQVVVFPFYRDNNIEEDFTLVVNTLINNGCNVYWSASLENPIIEIYDRIDKKYQNSKDVDNKIYYSINKEKINVYT